MLRASEVRVLDVGCAFGFGTAMLRPGREPVGLERSAEYLAMARARYPTLSLVGGSAICLPFSDSSFDSVLMLDVLEHLADPGAALAEAHRVLRPGGALILSVPHRGPQHWLDSLNLYSRLARRLGWRPLSPDERGYPEHRHFDPCQIAGLLSRFRIERIQRTGLGLGEPLNLLLLVLFRGLLGWEEAYRRLRFAAFGVTVVDDLILPGRLGYNLYVRAAKSV